MSKLQVVRVELAHSPYEIQIGAGLLRQADQFIAACGTFSQVVLITDANVEEPHARAVAELLADAGHAVHLLVVDAGESSKSTEVASALWERLLDAGIDRKGLVIAVGGGVVGDLAGFIAATFARGLAFVQMPTTLLAQVDSSVGGKVGVNLPAAKNIVGAFWQPQGVLIDPESLSTLPEREYRSGLAEVVKYGVIQDAEFFTWLEENAEALNERQADALVRTIARCCELKAEVVVADERETSGLRAILNYGHTFAHAIETVTDYGQFLHGEAVAIGMVQAAQLAQRMQRVDEDFTSRITRLLEKFHLPTSSPEALDPDALLAAMSKDKKAEHGQLRFVLPTRLGQVELTGDVDTGDVRAVLEGNGV